MRYVLKAMIGLVLLSAGLLLLLLLYNTRTPPNSSLKDIQTVEARQWDAPRTLRIITFNVHDLYLVSEDRGPRMEAIGKALTARDPDIVGIQEAFIAEDRNRLLTAVRDSRLQYSHYFPSGTVGSGLLMISAFPIDSVVFHRFTRNGKWYKTWHGDWWAGKGVAFARIALGPQQYLDFYNTHAHAGYGSDEYDADRRRQMNEITEFVNATHAANTPAIIVGDFNCRRNDLEFDAVVRDLRLQTLNDNLDGIDHVFSCAAGHYSFESTEREVIDEQITLDERLIDLSDHRAYLAVVEIRPHLEYDTGKLDLPLLPL